jgi:hypothetical protein
VLGTPRQVRNALAYVLLNARKHLGGKAAWAACIDPASSGAGSRAGAVAVRCLRTIHRPYPSPRPGCWLAVGSATASWTRARCLAAGEPHQGPRSSADRAEVGSRIARASLGPGGGAVSR